MKVNSVGNSDAISSYQNVKNNTIQKSSLTANISDSVELSEGAQKYSALLKAAKEAVEKAGADEDIRAADIAASIKNGSYNVSSDDVVKNNLSGYPSKG
jgi:anti-sigma28 factor (negative regulator of flagellin synthesis)